MRTGTSASVSCERVVITTRRTDRSPFGTPPVFSLTCRPDGVMAASRLPWRGGSPEPQPAAATRTIAASVAAVGLIVECAPTRPEVAGQAARRDEGAERPGAAVVAQPQPSGDHRRAGGGGEEQHTEPRRL